MKMLNNIDKIDINLGSSNF
jgi:hypothetical protein